MGFRCLLKILFFGTVESYKTSSLSNGFTIAMQRSTLLTVAGILIIIGSCLALVASLFSGLFIWAEYFNPSHLGSVRGISEAFYVEVSITIFELSALVLGLLSAVNIFKLKRFSLSALGASFLLIAGLLFFAKFLYNYLPHVEAIFTSFWSPIPQPWFGLPIIILASISIILLVSRRKEFDSKEINPLVTLEAILVLVSIISALSAIFSIVDYEQVLESSRIQQRGFPSHTAYSLLATMIVSICTLIFNFSRITLVHEKTLLCVSCVNSSFTTISTIGVFHFYVYFSLDWVFR